MSVPANQSPAAAARAAFSRGDFAEAERLARQALASGGAAPSAGAPGWNLLGVILRADGRPREAIVAYHRALECDESHALAWSNLGNALVDNGSVRSAVACQERAAALRPAEAEIRRNLGLALLAGRRFAEACENLALACTLAPPDGALVQGLALALLAAGRWEEGWQAYAVRPLPGLPQPWDGATRPGASLLVLPEQGFGDLIWSLRFLRAARSRVGQLLVQCRPGLAALFAAQGVADRVVLEGEPAPQTDFQVMQMSLPGLLGARPSASPAYLATPADRRARFAAIGASPARLRIGIVWSGNPAYPENSLRAVPAAALAEALSLPGVVLHSLQMGEARAEMPDSVPLTDLSPLLRDFADTAAAIAELDLIVMADSAVAHLAGALGKPVWLLAAHAAGWMWENPWYASLRLFRQPAPGAWGPVFDEVTAALLELLGSTAVHR